MNLAEQTTAQRRNSLAVQSAFREDDLGRRRLQKNGNLYQQGGWWKLRWREDQIGADEKSKRGWSKPVWIGPCDGPGKFTEKQAQRIAWDNFLSRLDQNTTVPQSVATVRQFVEKKFIPDHVAMLKKGGRAHYGSMLKHVLPALGEMRLRDVKQDDAQGVISGLLMRGYSVQTAKHVKNVISAIFRSAEEKQWFVGTNPAKYTKLPEMVRRERHALTFDQVTMLIGILKPPAREMVICSVLTSMNVAEMCGLQWKHVNLTDEWKQVDGEGLPPRSLAVRRQIYKGEFGSLKRGSRKRNVPLPGMLLGALTVMSQRPKLAGPEDPVFVARTGRPADEHNIARRHLKPAGVKLGMPWLSWHCMRHTHATLTDQIGMSSGDRIAMMGHSNIRMTTQYTHVDLERRRAVLDVMSEKLCEVKGAIQ